MKSIIVTFLIVLFLAANVMAAGSSTQPTAISKDVKLYNEGVKLMLAKKFAQAETQFRRSLNINDRFTEAHNNLAYTLRKQGARHYEEALEHYNRAIELNPGLPEPYSVKNLSHFYVRKILYVIAVYSNGYIM